MSETKNVINLEGRIDTNNAAEVEKMITSSIESHPGEEVAFDASKLEYISSAGLRVLMKVRKETGKPVAITEVSPEVYEIFETTGFTDLLDVSKRLREISVDGCEKLGEGGNGAVYRIDDDKIVKVYKPHVSQAEVDKERSFAKTAFINGVPSVIAYDTVKVGDSLGVVFEMLRSDTLGHAIAANPDKMEAYVDQYVELAKTLHSTHVPAGSFSRIQDILHGYADHLDKWCSSEEIQTLHEIVDAIPEADTVTHNDLHPGNIMIQDGELVLIDMPEVTMGPPICDLTSIYRDMIVAPNGEGTIISRSVGMPVEMISKVGNMFFMKYKGISDPAKLEEYYKKLGLLFAVNTVLLIGTGNDHLANIADRLINNLLRLVVLQNVETIKNLFRIM